MHEMLRPMTLGAGTFEAALRRSYAVDDDVGVLVDSCVGGGSRAERPSAFELAGPRRNLFFEPGASRAAIVTCGGLCPGLNDVIRAITMVLWHRYGLREILGIRYGYEGLIQGMHEPLLLQPEFVEDIHQHGGTVLGSSRGQQATGEIISFLCEREIDMLFTIGGDGTQRAALELTEALQERDIPIAVVGIPKTIDNDISYTDRTFGFETAVAESRDPITCAHMEAKGTQNGVGLVKLMGRESGFVAAYATLASSDVNLVLVPEVPFTMDSVFSFLKKRLAQKAHAVLVVAEGAGQHLVPSKGTDASGNIKFGDVGVFMKKAIADHFREQKIPVSVKYIDPSYTIRSAPATADDSVFCFHLGEAAAHAAMSGRTGMVTAQWNGHFVHVPMPMAVAAKKKIDPDGALWQSVLGNTGQQAGDEQ